METKYYTREANAVLNTLIEAGHEMDIMQLLEAAQVNFFIAPTVLSGLLRDQEITYRMVYSISVSMRITICSSAKQTAAVLVMLTFTSASVRR